MSLIDRNGLEVLGPERALALLDTVTLGRLGVISEGKPLVLPVNFRLVDGVVLIRTAAGTKLSAVGASASVSLEADHYDAFSHTGWSVVVEGTARLALGGDYPDDVTRRIPRWAPEGEAVVLEVTIEGITGRRLVAGSWLRTELFAPTH